MANEINDETRTIKLIDEKYLQQFLEHIKKIAFTTNFKDGYLVGEGKGTPLSTNAKTIVEAINELVDALPKSTSADGVNTYNVQRKTIGEITNLSATDVEDALTKLATATNYNFGGYIEKKTVGETTTVDIDNTKITKSEENDYKNLTNLATQGYVDQKTSETKNNVVSVESGKTDGVTGDPVMFVKLANATDEKYYVTLTSNNGVETAIELDASDFVKDSLLESVEYKKDNKGNDTNTLVFTWNILEENENENETKKKTTEINLSKFVDVYTEGNGIAISNHTVALKLKGDDYFTFDNNGKLVINPTKIAESTATADATSTKLATQGYVDKQIEDNMFDIKVIVFDASIYPLNDDATASTYESKRVHSTGANIPEGRSVVDPSEDVVTTI